MSNLYHTDSTVSSIPAIPDFRCILQAWLTVPRTEPGPIDDKAVVLYLLSGRISWSGAPVLLGTDYLRSTQTGADFLFMRRNDPGLSSEICF